MKLIDYLESYIDYEVSFIEIDEYFDRLTNGFNVSKVRELLFDIEKHSFVLRTEKEQEFNNESLQNISFPMGIYNSINDLPIVKRQNHFTNTTINEIDFEEIFYPGFFKRLQNLIDYLNSKIEKRDLNTPFKDKETENLFNYIVENWSNNNANKWGYIWEFLFTRDKGRLTNKTDFETYIRVNHKFTKGKPNYESCNSEKKYNELTELHKTFLKI